MIRITASILLLFFTLSLLGQDSNKPAFRFQGDSRKTFVDRKSADIYGIRGGLLFKNKYELTKTVAIPHATTRTLGQKHGK